MVHLVLTPENGNKGATHFYRGVHFTDGLFILTPPHTTQAHHCTLTLSVSHPCAIPASNFLTGF